MSVNFADVSVIPQALAGADGALVTQSVASVNTTGLATLAQLRTFCQLFDAGSAAAPSVALLQTDLGFYRVGADVLGFTAAGTARGNWGADGLRVGDATAATRSLDVLGRGQFRNSAAGNDTLKIGSVSLSTEFTDATVKQALIVCPHFTNAEEDLAMLWANTLTGTTATLNIGGGAPTGVTVNPFTEIRFFAGVNSATAASNNVGRVAANAGAIFGGGNVSVPVYALTGESNGGGTTISTVCVVQQNSTNSASAVGAKTARFLALYQSGSVVGNGADYVFAVADTNAGRAAAFGMALISNTSDTATARAYIATKSSDGATTLVERLSVSPAGFTMISLDAKAGGSDLLHVYSTTLSADVLRASDALGTVGVGGVPASTAMLTCYGRGSFTNATGGNVTLTIGSDVSLVTRTNVTQKEGRLACAHYTNAEEPFAMISAVSAVTTAQLYIGGGIAEMNAATRIYFYAAGNTTTVGGTNVGQINSANGACFGRSATTPGFDLEGRSSNSTQVATVAATQATSANALVTIGAKGTRFLGLNLTTTAGNGVDFVYAIADTTAGRAASFGMALVSNTSGTSATARAYVATKATDAATALVERLTVNPAGNVLIANDASAGTVLARLEVIQDAATGLPVLTLTQNDDDEPFVDFVGTSEAGVTKNISSFATVDGAKKGWIRWSVNGTDRWIAFHEAPVS